MTWPAYTEYNIGYSKGPIQKNIQVVFVGHHTNLYLMQPTNFTSGPLFDGFIKIYALNDTYLHDILQETLDTPVQVEAIPANLEPNP